MTSKDVWAVHAAIKSGVDAAAEVLKQQGPHDPKDMAEREVDIALCYILVQLQELARIAGKLHEGELRGQSW